MNIGGNVVIGHNTDIINFHAGNGPIGTIDWGAENRRVRPCAAGKGLRFQEDVPMLWNLEIGSSKVTSVNLMGTSIVKDDNNILWMMLKKINSLESMVINGILDNCLGVTGRHVKKYM